MRRIHISPVKRSASGILVLFSMGNDAQRKSGSCLSSRTYFFTRTDLSVSAGAGTGNRTTRRESWTCRLFPLVEDDRARGVESVHLES